MEFKELLKMYRITKNFSINQLAKTSGVSASLISLIENGKRGTPKQETIQKLADALCITVEDLTPDKKTYPSNTTEKNMNKSISAELYDMFVLLNKLPPKRQSEIKSLIKVYLKGLKYNGEI